MKKILVPALFFILMISCKDDDINVFDKSAEERVAEKVAALKSELVAPANGWKLKYQPESGSGFYYVLLDFNDDNTVTIQTDLSGEENAYHEQTITYRIDNSLGLELILESYSFFSFLFEQNDASYLAEFEFVYVNKTPDDALVFKSKSDPGDSPTILVFEPADANDDKLLGRDLSSNLLTLSEDLDLFSSSYSMAYENRDLIVFLSMNELQRNLTITGLSKISDPTATKSVDFETTYTITGDSISFTSPFKGTYFSYPVNIKGIKLTKEVVEQSKDLCADPIILHGISGVTSENQPVVFATSIEGGSGQEFIDKAYFYYSPVEVIFRDGSSIGNEISTNITGVTTMQIYFGVNIGNGPTNLIGFSITNPDQSRTFAMKNFTYTLSNNNLVMTIDPEFVFLENEQTQADVDKINLYLDALTSGGHTYIYKYADGIYELNNPCTGYSFAFYDGVN